MNRKKDIFVIGHKNPDTASICSAIAYANLKNQISEENHVPKRAGDVSSETQYVLDFFGVKAPEYIAHVGTQVKDVSIKPTIGLSKEISLKNAWTIMRDTEEPTMPIVYDGKLEGIISVKDIATANMDVYETRILSLSKTKYHNILEAIDGEMIVGNPEDIVSEGGKILIGAANPELMETYLEKGDILLTGNRYESQLCAVESGIGCLVVCMGANVSESIQELAKEKGCAVIGTPHDTYMTARLISQSTPLSYFMKKDNLVTFYMDDFITEIKETLAKIRHRDFPVIDSDGNYKGMLSRRSLLDMTNKKIIMVDHNEKSQAVNGIEEAEVLEIIDHHRLGTMQTTTPVYFRNQPVGCTSTIVYNMYLENGVEIPKNMAGLMCSAILSDTLMFRSPTCTPTDQKAAEALAKIAGIDIREHAENMFRAGSNLAGKTPKEIFYQDFKKFNANGLSFGAGQISSLDKSALEDLRGQIADFMAEQGTGDLDMLFFLLTNIIEESSDLVFFGKDAKEFVEKAFGGTATETYIHLPGVVSRKKQFVPSILNAL